ncbi:MAG TPA: hypothetical protein VMS17_24700 [Gemmataceae bacterium]|nr:hypothetical protein [Gemmataceae bacterium]
MAWPQLRLFYSWKWGAKGEPQSADYHVRLATTRPRFGGLRWWFICPLAANAQPCNRRVGKLYLPSQQRYFGCRRCYDLTYASVQQHDKRVDALRRNPALIERILADRTANPLSSKLLIALKALR